MLEVDGVELLPLVLGRAEEVPVRAVVADVVHEHVDPLAVDGQGSVRELLDGCSVADVAHHRDGAAAGALDRGDGGFEQLTVDVVHHDGRARGGQAAGDTATDPRRAAGDDGDLPGEQLAHVPVAPFRRGPRATSTATRSR